MGESLSVDCTSENLAAGTGMGGLRNGATPETVGGCVFEAILPVGSGGDTGDTGDAGSETGELVTEIPGRR